MNQKEVKYQAWDNDQVMFQSIMTEDEGMIFVPTDEVDNPFDDQIWYPASYVFHTDSFTKRRFTGLLDKHGKEIYERDVILSIWEDDPKKPVEVKYDERWCAFAPFFLYGTASVSNSNMYEVIGDSYQNPELLTNDKE